VPDLGGLAGDFADALAAADFRFERPSLAKALDGYERWLKQRIGGLEWGESDCAIVMTEAVLASGTYEIDLRRHVGEWGSERSIELCLVFDVNRTSRLRGLWGTSVEAFDDAPAAWIKDRVRFEPGIAAALADDVPLAVELRIDGMPVS